MNIDKVKKYIGSCCGNSFIILDCRNIKKNSQFKSKFATKNIEKYGVDSALFLEKSKGMDALMEIFEKDGSESESCGNGTILIAHLLGLNNGRIEMKDNAASVSSNSNKQSISMNIKFSHIEKVSNEKNCLFVKMGEPHVVYIVSDLNKFDLVKVSKKIQKKYPEGVNVNAIQRINDSYYLIKTYERGVFAETKSCGTGSLSAFIALTYFNNKLNEKVIKFKSAGGSHWVSRNKNMLKLEVLNKFCKIRNL